MPDYPGEELGALGLLLNISMWLLFLQSTGYAGQQHAADVMASVCRRTLNYWSAKIPDEVTGGYSEAPETKTE
jgi:hypothetical protein